MHNTKLNAWWMVVPAGVLVAASLAVNPEMIAGRFLPAEASGYRSGIVAGLWCFRGWLVLGGVLLLAGGRLFTQTFGNEPAGTESRGGMFANLSAMERWFLAALLLLSLALRVPGLGGSFTFDEVFLVKTFITQNPAKMFFHPSGSAHLAHTIIAKGVASIVGVSEWSVRLPAMVFGAVTPIVLYVVIRRALSAGVAATAAILVAVSPFHIWYSQEAKGNTLLVLCVVLSWWFWLRLGRRWTAQDAIGYAVSLSVGALAHLSGIVVIVGQAAVTMCLPLVEDRLQWRLRSRSLILHGVALYAVILVYSIVLPFLFTQAGAVSANEGAANPLSVIATILTRYSFVDTSTVAACVTVLFVLWGVVETLRKRPGWIAFGLGPFVLGLVLMTALRLFSHARYHMFVFPGLCVCLAVGIVSVWNAGKERRNASGIILRSLVLLAGIFLLFGVTVSLGEYYARPKSNFRAIAERVEKLDRTTPVYVLGCNEKAYPLLGLSWYTRRFVSDEGVREMLTKLSDSENVCVVAVDTMHARASYPELWKLMNSSGIPDERTVLECLGELDQFRARESVMVKMKAGELRKAVGKGR